MGIKLSTFLSNLLRTGILPLTRSTVRVNYFLLSPTTQYSFWVQGYLPSGIFSLTLFNVRVNNRLLYSPTQYPLILGVSVSRLGIIHKCKSITPLSLNTMSIVLLLFPWNNWLTIVSRKNRIAHCLNGVLKHRS